MLFCGEPSLFQNLVNVSHFYVSKVFILYIPIRIYKLYLNIKIFALENKYIMNYFNITFKYIILVFTGNIMTYMDSYMHIRVNKDITYSNFIWVNSVTTASQGLFMYFGGILEKKIGVQLTCLIGSCIMRFVKFLSI